MARDELSHCVFDASAKVPVLTMGSSTCQLLSWMVASASQTLIYVMLLETSNALGAMWAGRQRGG